MADYKLSSSSSKNQKTTQKNIKNPSPPFSEKNPATLTFSSSFSHIFLPVFILQTTQNPPCYKALKEKQPQKGQKRRGHFHTIRKIIRKRPDVCVNTPYHKPYNNTETCINTGFKQNCCHCFLSQYKKYPLLLSITFLSTFILPKCQKAPFYKALKEKMKHKTDEKEEEDCPVYT